MMDLDNSQNKNMVENLNYGVIKIEVFLLKLLGLWPASKKLIKTKVWIYILSMLYTGFIILLTFMVVLGTLYAIIEGALGTFFIDIFVQVSIKIHQTCSIILLLHLTRGKIQNLIRMLQKFPSFLNPDLKILLILFILTIILPSPSFYFNVQDIYNQVSAIDQLWDEFIEEYQLIKDIYLFKSWLILNNIMYSIYVLMGLSIPSIIILGICLSLGKEFDKNVDCIDNLINSGKIYDTEKYLSLQQDFEYLVKVVDRINNTFYIYIIVMFINGLTITFGFIYFYAIDCLGITSILTIIFCLLAVICILCISGQIIETKVYIL